MIVWIDAQLPPSLAPWMCDRFGVKASSMRYLGMHDAEDAQIFERARSAGNVVLISKDSDFIDLIAQRGIPPRLLWVSCGNVTNRRLREVFERVFLDAMTLLEAGEEIVEIGDA